MARAMLLVLATVLVLTTSAFDLDPEMTTSDTSDSLDCEGTLRSLMSCLPAVEGDNPVAPSKECCTAVVHMNADCLCNAISDGDIGSFLELNVDAALQLPRECGRVVPKGFNCAGYHVPSYP